MYIILYITLQDDSDIAERMVQYVVQQSKQTSTPDIEPQYVVVTYES